MYDLAKIVWICKSEVVRISHLVKYVRIAVRSGWNCKYKSKSSYKMLIKTTNNTADKIQAEVQFSFYFYIFFFHFNFS